MKLGYILHHGLLDACRKQPIYLDSHFPEWTENMNGKSLAFVIVIYVSAKNICRIRVHMVMMLRGLPSDLI